jgi:hypothetical protein
MYYVGGYSVRRLLPVVSPRQVRQAAHVAEGTRADVLRALEARVGEIAEEAVRVLQATFPAYAPVTADALLPGVLADLQRGLRALDERRTPRDDELEEVERVADLRARQGVPLDEMLQGFQAVARLVWRDVQREAELARLPPEETLSFVDEIWRWLDVVVVRAAQAHRKVEVEAARRDEGQRVAFLRGLLHGTLAPPEVRTRLATWGLPAEVAYVPFRARSLRDLPAREWLGKLRAGSGLVAVVDDVLVGVSTARPTVPEGDVVVGVGPAVEVAHLPESYAAASRALDAAGALGVTGDVSLADLGLLAAVVSEPEVGDALVRRYLDPLHESGGIGADLEQSLRGYLTSGMSVEAAARELVVHQNTLRYRLKRVQELTGVDLRDPAAVAELWWALQRRRVGPVAWGAWTD